MSWDESVPDMSWGKKGAGKVEKSNENLIACTMCRAICIVEGIHEWGWKK